MNSVLQGGPPTPRWTCSPGGLRKGMFPTRLHELFIHPGRSGDPYGKRAAMVTPLKAAVQAEQLTCTHVSLGWSAVVHRDMTSTRTDASIGEARESVHSVFLPSRPARNLLELAFGTSRPVRAGMLVAVHGSGCDSALGFLCSPVRVEGGWRAWIDIISTSFQVVTVVSVDYYRSTHGCRSTVAIAFQSPDLPDGHKALMVRAASVPALTLWMPTRAEFDGTLRQRTSVPMRRFDMAISTWAAQ